MDSASTISRDLAHLIVAIEQGDDGDPTSVAPAVLNVFARLSARLSSSFGSNGYRALLTRALSLAAVDFPWLSAVSVDSDASLSNVIEAAATMPTDDAANGSVAIVISFIELLGTFLGSDLSVRLVKSAWPLDVVDTFSSEEYTDEQRG